MKPITSTAFYCCGTRMQDADSVKPVCNDTYARIFMNEYGLNIFEAFKEFKYPNASNVTRHRIIDDILRRELKVDPNIQIILIGSGFDTRPFRLVGGIWVELDEPQILNYKNERLPATNCKNPLKRIPIDFSNESLEEKLISFPSQLRTIIILEGVLMYLGYQTIEHLLNTLISKFPSHQFICDLMKKEFFEKHSYKLHKKIEALGTSFITSEQPDEVFLEKGYSALEIISIIGKASEFGNIRIPLFLLKSFFRSLYSGYSIYLFEYID